MDELKPAIPESALRRMPVYLDFLKHLPPGEELSISSVAIARELGLNQVQVRKDLALTAANGRPKTGYRQNELIAAIESFLGYYKTDEALLVGVGKLGQSLLGYNGFAHCGLDISVAFDNDSGKTGSVVNGVKVLDIKKLPNLAPRLGLQIGIITVPAEAAQKVCDLMIGSGIIGIWNFAPVKLQVPAGVVVQNENFTASYLVLSSKLKNMSLQQD